MSELKERTIEEKWDMLLEILRGYRSAAVAFSGGTDSTFLLRAAKEALGEKMAAVTVISGLFPGRERKEAEEFCRQEGIRHVLCPVEELEIEGFRENPRNRCYLCKREIFGRIRKLAEEQGLACVAEGSNMDDLGDYRPGLQAIEELGIRSPLREAGLY